MSRKPRSDCKPLQMSDENQLKVFGWCKTMGFEKARLLAIEELGETFSVGSLHTAYGHWVTAESENSIIRAVSGADAIMAAVGNDLGNLDAAIEVKLKEAIFAASMSGNTDKLKDVASVFCKMQKNEMVDKAINLQVDKFQFDAAKAALEHAAALKSISNDSSRSHAEKVEAVRHQLFSVLPTENV